MITESLLYTFIEICRESPKYCFYFVVHVYFIEMLSLPVIITCTISISVNRFTFRHRDTR